MLLLACIRSSLAKQRHTLGSELQAQPEDHETRCSAVRLSTTQIAGAGALLKLASTIPLAAAGRSGRARSII
jgi:hypothetical protein